MNMNWGTDEKISDFKAAMMYGWDNSATWLMKLLIDDAIGYEPPTYETIEDMIWWVGIGRNNR